MNEQQALAKMISPNMRRSCWSGGVLQIWVTRACNLACVNCTQGSNLGGNPGMMTPEQFETACISLKDYFGVVGVFGGNPAMNPHFEAICEIMRKHIPRKRRGLWCNNLMGKGKAARATFNPSVSNLNVHLDRAAYNEFKRDWPESMPFGLDKDSRHSPPWVALQDVLKTVCPECNGNFGWFNGTDGDTYASDPGDVDVAWQKCDVCDGAGVVFDESQAWELISRCDINREWSAMIGVFRGELRGWFCEIAGAQAMLHQREPDYPDTGLPVVPGWWNQGMAAFAGQVRKHCMECGVPLKGHGALAQGADGCDQVSATHQIVYKPKSKTAQVELVTERGQLGPPLGRMVDYIGNSKK